MIRRSFIQRLAALCGIAVAAKVVPAASVEARWQNATDASRSAVSSVRNRRDIGEFPSPPQNGDIWLDFSGTYHLRVNGKWVETAEYPK